MAKVIRSVVEAADAKSLRSLAALNGIKFIGKETDDVRAELLAIAVEEPAKKECKSAKKAAEAAADGAISFSAPVEPKVRSVRAPISAEDIALIATLPSKKARVITLRERGYSIHQIGEAVGLHPTNVSRYVRDAGLSTSTAVVPQERRDRIKASIAAKKVDAAAAGPKAESIPEVSDAEVAEELAAEAIAESASEIAAE